MMLYLTSERLNSLNSLGVVPRQWQLTWLRTLFWVLTIAEGGPILQLVAAGILLYGALAAISRALKETAWAGPSISGQKHSCSWLVPGFTPGSGDNGVVAKQEQNQPQESGSQLEIWALLVLVPHVVVWAWWPWMKCHSWRGKPAWGWTAKIFRIFTFKQNTNYPSFKCDRQATKVLQLMRHLQMVQEARPPIMSSTGLQGILYPVCWHWHYQYFSRYSFCEWDTMTTSSLETVFFLFGHKEIKVEFPWAQNTNTLDQKHFSFIPVLQSHQMGTWVWPGLFMLAHANPC